jgi:hypothetical protein
MHDRSQEPDSPGRGNPKVRFEATVYPGAGERSLSQVADLDLDRLPDPGGETRLLVTADEAAMLAEQGYEVRLLKAHPVKPLDGSLVMDDKAAEDWLEQQVKGVRREGGS